MKKKIKKYQPPKGVLKAYFLWPAWLGATLIGVTACLYFVDRMAAGLMTAYTMLYFLAIFGISTFSRQGIRRELVSYAAEYNKTQKMMLKELALPFAMLNNEGALIWGNNEFLDIIDNEKAAKRSITNIFHEITPEAFPEMGQDEIKEIIYNERNYKAVLRPISQGEEGETAARLTAGMIAITLYDETETASVRKMNEEQRVTVGLIYIDNYEEALESIDEVRRSLLVALVDRKINKYMQSIDAIIRKMEKDKYIVIFKRKYLTQIQNTRFALLDEVRAINIGNEMSVTLSIGLGVTEESYLEAYEYARAAIDLALGRGGDQAVVKTTDSIRYFGGKSQQVEKNTRVKARVKAHALKELVEAKDKVVIMGHSIGDVDSFGAAVGVYRIAKTLNTKAHIVISEVTSTMSPLLQRFLNNPEYEEDLVLTGEQAKEVVDANTLLVVVDVNRPNYTDCPSLLAMTKTIVVLDHHRQTEEEIENAVLSYIEPYASSACELVAEILQYVDEDLKLRALEADAMYAGIVIDTNNFVTKAGVRTFEAAAFLRRNGADVTKIRKMFRSDKKEYSIRATAVAKAEVYLDHYAMTECFAEEAESPTILGAQVANELLEISEVKASFVFTPFHDKIHISARSIDELNVQVVMEKLGGGGHMSVAGVQLEGVTVKEAEQMVKDVLDRMIEDGEI